MRNHCVAGPNADSVTVDCDASRLCSLLMTSSSNYSLNAVRLVASNYRVRVIQKWTFIRLNWKPILVRLFINLNLLASPSQTEKAQAKPISVRNILLNRFDSDERAALAAAELLVVSSRVLATSNNIRLSCASSCPRAHATLGTLCSREKLACK